jgi:hypothetical protein
MARADNYRTTGTRDGWQIRTLPYTRYGRWNRQARLDAERFTDGSNRLIIAAPEYRNIETEEKTDDHNLERQ